VDPEAALDAQATGAVLLDTRAPDAFASGHLRGSVNVSLDGRFAEFAGDVVRPDQDVVLVADAARATEARVRLGRIGFDRVIGVLVDVETVLVARADLAERARRLPAGDFAAWRDSEPDLQLVDLRNPAEQESGVIPGARSLPLPQLLDRIEELDPQRPTVVYCAGGYRSSIGASVLRSQGFGEVADILGGFDAWRAVRLPIDTTSSPSLAG
jgi:rhodanese-related sulfurtransferase